MGENDDKGGGLGWRAALPADLQNNETLSSYKEVKDLGAAHLDLTTKYKDMERKVSEYEGRLKNALFLPADDAADEERAAFYNKLGRPETPDKYSFKKPEDWPEDLPYNEEFERGFREFIHKIGLPDRAAGQIYSWYSGIVLEQAKKDLERRNALLTEGQKKMQEEWKDKFDENVKITARAVEAFGGPDLLRFLDESGLGNHPLLVKTFYNIGRAMTEDQLADGYQAHGGRKTKAVGSLTYPSMTKK